MEINSIHNKKIKILSKLLTKKGRVNSEYFLVEGKHLVDEAMSLGIAKEVFSTSGIGTKVSKEVIKKLSDTETPQEIVAVVKKVKPKKISDKVLVLNNIQDPGNIGTLIRSAKAFGYETVITNIKDIYNPKIIRSSQGAILSINILPMSSYKDLNNHQLIGTIVKGGKDIKEFKPDKKHAIVLGNEAKGLSIDEQKDMDVNVSIRANFESLNVAIAGSIIMNEYKEKL